MGRGQCNPVRKRGKVLYFDWEGKAASPRKAAILVDMSAKPGVWLERHGNRRRFIQLPAAVRRCG